MDLQGWDTAYATTLDLINKSLAKPEGVLTSFELDEEGMSLAGKFGAWSIVPGGSGTLLHLKIDIASGTISGGGAPNAKLDGLSVIFEIDLLLLPPDASKQQKLVFNFQKVGKASDKPSPGLIVPIKVNDPNKVLSFMQEAVLGAGIAQNLVTKAADISFAFAQVNLVPPDAASSWLTPVKCAYTYYETTAGAGYLVILSSTTNRDISGLSRNVDPALVSGTGNAFFGVSEAMFQQHVILPVLPKVYTKTDASYFAFNAANKHINATKPIPLNGVKSGAIWYYPIIQSLDVKVSGSTVVSTVTGNCDMHMGMSMTFSVTSTSQSSFNATKATLSLAKDPKPQTSHASHIPWYDYLIGAIPDIIMAIVVPIIADGIADGLNSQVSDMDFAKLGPLSVKWPGMKTFDISGGGLNSAFQMSGTVG